MNSLIRNKSFLAIFLLVNFVSPSYALPVKDRLKTGIKSCKQSFIKIVNIISGSRIGRERVHNLIMRLDWMLEEQGEIKPHQIWLHQNPILLMDLHKFRKTLESLLKKKISMSDAQYMQEKLEQMVLPWVFWKPKSSGRSALGFIREREKAFKRSLQEWGESILRRTLNEEEVYALERAFDYTVRDDMMVDIQYFTKQKILKKAGFSERELDQLGRKTVLRGSETVSIEIPQRTTEEARLRAKGYNSAYTKGMDEILELIAVGKKLLEQIDPYETHVPYFAKKLREYITFMEKGIRNSTQREEFDLLKQYVELLIKEEGVTYEQFIAVSLRLPDTISNNRPNAIHPFSVEELVRKFPEIIAMPTTVGKIGTISLNTIRSEKIEPIGLINKRTTYDGREEEPIYFAYHDVNHIMISDGTHKPFYDKIKEKRENWPVEKGKNIESAYHILTHETTTEGSPKIFVYAPDRIERDIKRGLYIFTLKASHDKNAYKEDIDLSTDSDRKIQTIVDDFKQAFDEIQRERMLENSQASSPIELKFSELKKQSEFTEGHIEAKVTK